MWTRVNPNNDSIIQLETFTAQDVFNAFPTFDAPQVHCNTVLKLNRFLLHGCFSVEEIDSV